jgi:cytidylate kinase
VGVGAKQSIKIVFLGPDCGGKTTLARRIGSRLGIESTANRRVPGDLEAITQVALYAINKLSRDNPEDIILDQWQYPVDIVYRAALEDTNSPLTAIAHKLAEYMRENSVLFLFVTADEKTLQERFAVRGDELWDIEQIVKVAAVYETYMVHSGLNYFKIDTTSLNEEQAEMAAVRYIKKFYGREI